MVPRVSELPAAKLPQLADGMLPVAAIFPFTCNLAVGEPVPMPRLPDVSNLACSTLFARKTNGLLEFVPMKP